jgi:hypothetical protein
LDQRPGNLTSAAGLDETPAGGDTELRVIYCDRACL